MASAFSPLLRRVGASAARLSLRRSPLKTTVLPTLTPPLARPLARPLHTSPILQQTGAFRPSLRLGQSAAAAAEVTPKAAKSFFPETTAKPVAFWLFSTATLVFAIVVVGGLTRLTESGLSITEWKPITGAVPPKTKADWEEEFEKYKSSPEFIKLNSKMTLEEFKFIYHMEWGHRQLGRIIGVAFVLPALFFVARGKVSKSRARNLLLIASGIGFQGALGWWMVKSGLVHDNFKEDDSVPRVSQYRLTAHLGAAFLVYTGMMWNALAILQENRIVNEVIAPKTGAASLAQNPLVRKTRMGVAILAAAIFLTAMSGGMVAGLDAGLIYNEFPMMGKGLTPPKSELFNEHYCQKEDKSDLWWRNLFENPATVQLEHRILAVSTFTAIVAFWLLTRRLQYKAVLNKKQLSGIAGMMHVGSLQVVLGISTLIYMVPTHLAATHQANALALLTMGVVAMSRFHTPAIQKNLDAAQTLAALKPVHGLDPAGKTLAILKNEGLVRNYEELREIAEKAKKL